MTAKLTDYWQNEKTRLASCLTEAQAQLVAASKGEIDARAAVAAASKAGETAQVALNASRQALASIVMPADGHPLLKAMRDAIADVRAARAQQVAAEVSLRTAQVTRTGLQGRVDQLTAAQSTATAALKAAVEADVERTALAAKLRAAPVKDLKAAATTALNNFDTSARNKVLADFPQNADDAKDFFKAVLDRENFVAADVSRRHDEGDNARAEQRNFIESSTRKADLVPALRDAHTAAVAELRRVAELKPKVDAAILLLQQYGARSGRFITSAEYHALTAIDTAKRETSLDLLKKLTEKQQEFSVARQAFEEALAAAWIATPDVTFASLVGAGGAVKAEFDAFATAAGKVDTAATVIKGSAGEPLRCWFAAVPDALWDALEAYEAAQGLLKQVSTGLAPAQVADAWETAEDELVTALKARDAEAASIAMRQALLDYAVRIDADASALAPARLSAARRFVLPA